MSVFCQHFQNASLLELQGQFHFKFNMQPSSKGGKKIYIFRPGHMTKMAAMPIYGKNVKNLPLQNHWADCLETWYAASCIANHHFGHVTLRLQKINESQCSGERPGPHGPLVFNAHWLRS